MQKIDPILVDEVDFDDEWITEKEDSLLPEYPCWLDEDNLFAVDIVRFVSLTSYENDLLHESNIGSLRDTSEADPSAKCQKTSGKLQCLIVFKFCYMLLFIMSTSKNILYFSSHLVYNKKHQCALRLMTLIKD